MVLALVECRADVNATNTMGQTPVWMAARGGHTETVWTLVKCGADVNTADKDGYTPLHAAVMNNRASVIWTFVWECRVNTPSLNHDGKKARDLAPPGSITYKVFEWLEELQDPGHALYAKENAEKRGEVYDCVLCLEETKRQSHHLYSVRAPSVPRVLGRHACAARGQMPPLQSTDRARRAAGLVARPAPASCSSAWRSRELAQPLA
jgi:hypothetical protein